jgi:hypothetical protein
MFIRIIQLAGIACFFCLFIGCSTANNKPVLISFSSDSNAVVISGISAAGLAQLKNSPAQDSLVYSLLSVLQTPSEQDTSVVEQPVKGLISVRDSVVIFKPERSFVKGRDYLVLTYLNSQFANAGAMLKGQMNYKLKPVQKILSR